MVFMKRNSKCKKTIRELLSDDKRAFSRREVKVGSSDKINPAIVSEWKTKKLGVANISPEDLSSLRLMYGMINVEKKRVSTNQNLKYIKYTIAHIRAMEAIYSIKGIENPNPNHDIDKVGFYLVTSKENAHNLHRRLQVHHNCNFQDMDVILEEIVDWESAHLTKPDKPLSAYETLNKYYKDSTNYKLFKMKMREMKLWKVGNYTPITDKEFEELIDVITIEEVESYIDRSLIYIEEIINTFDEISCDCLKF